MITYRSSYFADCLRFPIFVYIDNTRERKPEHFREHQKLNGTKNEIMLGNSQANIKTKASYHVLPHIIWPQVRMCFQTPGIYTHMYK